ncbi:MAG: mechanosensitive ion channel family protein [Proteobacteria bacterium]|nr:mechanosensitive ion channel family protein [Pseudomonadota bacterium]
MTEFINELLVSHGVNLENAGLLTRSILIVLAIIFSIIANFIAKRIIITVIARIIAQTKSKWDDIFFERKVFEKLSHFAPAAVLYFMLPLALEGNDRIISISINAVYIYMIIISILVLNSFLNSILDIYSAKEVSKEVPIKSFIQSLKIVVYFIAVILIISIVFSKTPIYFISGMGAFMAILLLVFKDVILGFVAGIQLSANKMLANGDWIEMPKYGADGEVMDVALTTVKIQNWDKTVTTIPTYALISESFINWRGMQLSGGRRIKREVCIDINTIKFCTDEMVERFSKIRYIAEYMEHKKKELAEYNKLHNLEDSGTANKRQLTNIGTFRAYVVAYLKNHPMINQEMTFIVRQMAPAKYGLPIQIYVFCKDKAWANYEGIQSDIFDHILAIVPEFDLRVYQSPAGIDFAELKNLK